MTGEYDKLVRDRIPEIIEGSGEVPIVHEASDAEYERRLVDKLREEVGEYTEERDVEELADVMEVVHALREVHGMTEERLASIRATKADERGRFEEGIVSNESKNGIRRHGPAIATSTSEQAYRASGARATAGRPRTGRAVSETNREPASAVSPVPSGARDRPVFRPRFYKEGAHSAPRSGARGHPTQ